MRFHLIAALLALAGCKPAVKTEAVPASASASAPATAGAALIQPQVDALNKARAVEDDLQRQADARAKAMDAQTK
ncbi:MAG TPA: hypothetical protein VIT92_05000 [Burkholderiaceae bacterium]